MTWRRVAVYWALALAVGVQLWLTLREHGGPVLADEPRVAPIVDTEPAAVDAVLTRKAGAALDLRKRGGRWEVVRPAGVRVSSDLVAALVDSLATIPPVEVLTSEPGQRLSAYGLDPPQSIVRLAVGETEVATIELGERNPTRTAVYARRPEQERLYLLGLNAQYYLDLLYEQAAASAAEARDGAT